MTVDSRTTADSSGSALPLLSPLEQEWLSLLLAKVRALRFGTVQLKVHEAQVVILETIEQTRFEVSPKSKR